MCLDWKSEKKTERVKFKECHGMTECVFHHSHMELLILKAAVSFSTTYRSLLEIRTALAHRWSKTLSVLV